MQLRALLKREKLSKPIALIQPFDWDKNISEITESIKDLEFSLTEKDIRSAHIQSRLMHLDNRLTLLNPSIENADQTSLKEDLYGQLRVFFQSRPPGGGGTPQPSKTFRWYAVAKTLGTAVLEDNFFRYVIRGDFFSWCCGVATERKIDDLIVEHAQVIKFINNLRQGLRNSVQQINATSEIFNKYHETVRKGFDKTDTKIRLVTSYIYSTLTRLLRIERPTVQAEVLNTCKDHKIPALIVQPLGLAADLTALEKDINSKNYRLAIPVEQLSKYYKLDIVDCTVADQKIYIHIRVPIISEINSDTFVITHVKNETIIQCPEEKIEISDEAYNQPGALQVMLSYQCSLVVNSKEVISSRFPCTSEGVNPELIHVLPAIWSNLKTYVIKPTKHETIFKNMTECLDANWTRSVPHLNLSTTTLLNNFKEQQTVSNHPYVLQGDATVYIWNIVLSIICIYLLCKINRRGLAVLAIINPVLAFDTEEMKDDGELFDFQYATRSHVKRTFANNYDIPILLKGIKERENIIIIEGHYLNTLDNYVANMSCKNQKLLELVYLDYKRRVDWTRAFVNMCQTKRLQLDIVNVNTLKNALDIVQRNSVKQKHVIAISTISQYYTMPLIECVISQDTGKGGIHVPLLKATLKDLTMKRVITTTYDWNEYTCSVNIPSFSAALVERNERWSIVVPKCDSFKEDLCLVTEAYNAETLALLCIRQVLVGEST
ncbi:hypothetical protein FQA39_LY16731 [Lamprigera yunnana]|nr:hypothetical protein FQA39_LY16731 [Lamprigera yunnana]